MLKKLFQKRNDKVKNSHGMSTEDNKTKTTANNNKTPPAPKTYRAIYNGQVIAQSNETILVEGNHYFPPHAINTEYLKPVPGYTTACPWKGQASYYNVQLDGQRRPAQNVAWTYPHPKPGAQHIQNYVAFWKDVRVVAV